MVGHVSLFQHTQCPMMTMVGACPITEAFTVTSPEAASKFSLICDIDSDMDMTNAALGTTYRAPHYDHVCMCRCVTSLIKQSCRLL